MRVPIGVFGMIFESRPNVTIEAASLSIKSGNACILRGGSEAIDSNKALAKLVQQALTESGLPADAVQLVQTTDREVVGQLIAMPQYVDVIIPRGGKGLIERIQAEGRNSPADVLLTVDVGNLTQATDAGIAQPIDSPVLEAAIPPAYRAADKEWFGLTRRARVVYASKERVKLDKITYEDLADPRWHGKICIRSGQHVYNVALIASLIAVAAITAMGKVGGKISNVLTNISNAMT